MRFYAILCDLAGFFRNLALREDRFSVNLAPTQPGKAPLVFDWANTNPQRHGGPKNARIRPSLLLERDVVGFDGLTGLLRSNANYGGLANFTGFLERELLTVAP